VLEHHVGSPDNTPGSTPGNTSGTDDRSDADDRSDDATSAVGAFDTVDYSICVTSLDSDDRGDGESGE
jgi:hypothetical protein